MSESINPYAPPAATILSLPENPFEVWTVLFSAWRIFRAQIVVISAIMMMVWIPCELFSSYVDYFVLEPTDYIASFNLGQLVNYLFGVIATAGVVHVALRHSSGGTAKIGQAFGAGLNAWSRMCWSQFLTDAVLLLSALLLVLPYFYLMPRLILVDCVVVCEGLSGNAAIERSYALTREHYWKVALIVLIVVGIEGVWPALSWFLTECFSMSDHWLLNAAMNLISDLISGYETVLVFCLYRALSQLPGKSDQA